MVPSKGNPLWRFLVTGRASIQSTSPAFNMLLCTCKMRCQHNASEASIEELALHAFEFFTKYQKLLQPELKQLRSSGSSSGGDRAHAAIQT